MQDSTAQPTRHVHLPFDMSLAACKGMDVASFFPSSSSGTNHKKIPSAARAIAVCSGCAVLEQCRDYGIRYEANGIWGGLTETEREYRRVELGIRLPLGEKTDLTSRARSKHARRLRYLRDKETKGIEETK